MDFPRLPLCLAFFCVLPSWWLLFFFAPESLLSTQQQEKVFLPDVSLHDPRLVPQIPSHTALSLPLCSRSPGLPTFCPLCSRFDFVFLFCFKPRLFPSAGWPCLALNPWSLGQCLREQTLSHCLDKERGICFRGKNCSSMWEKEIRKGHSLRKGRLSPLI